MRDSTSLTRICPSATTEADEKTSTGNSSAAFQEGICSRWRKRSAAVASVSTPTSAKPERAAA
jgi:hypothetical protein